MPRLLQCTIPFAQDEDICQESIITVLRPIIINGTLSDTLTNTVTFKGYSRVVYITINNYFGKQVTVIGTQNGTIVSDIINFPIGGGEVQTGTQLFDTITSVNLTATNGAPASIKIGSGPGFVFYKIDPYLVPIEYNLTINVLENPDDNNFNYGIYGSNEEIHSQASTYSLTTINNNITSIITPNPTPVSFTFPVSNTDGNNQYLPYMPFYKYIIVSLPGFDDSEIEEVISLTFKQI